MAHFFQSTNSKRQKLLRPLVEPVAPPADALMAEEAVAPVEAVAMRVSEVIHTRVGLQRALVDAFILELATVPPYMCGLYSIRDGTNQESAKLIRSVLVEEMLHMVLVANLLNAISKPAEVAALLRTDHVMRTYPTTFPGGIVPPEPRGFEIRLLPFSKGAIAEFLTIERPSDPGEPQPAPGTFHSIGQFYQSIRWGFKNCARAEKLFIGDPTRQITEQHYYGSGGKIVAVESLDTANLALEEIVGQGEGIDGTIHDPDSTLFGEGIEYAHYFKFKEIECGRFYRANDTNQQAPTKSVPTGEAFEVTYSNVHAMKPDPRVVDYAHDPSLQHMAIEFNHLYTRLVDVVIEAANGAPETMMRAISFMYELRERAKSLMNVQLPDGKFAGPTFEYTRETSP